MKVGLKWTKKAFFKWLSAENLQQQNNKVPSAKLTTRAWQKWKLFYIFALEKKIDVRELKWKVQRVVIDKDDLPERMTEKKNFIKLMNK